MSVDPSNNSQSWSWWGRGPGIISAYTKTMETVEVINETSQDVVRDTGQKIKRYTDNNVKLAETAGKGATCLALGAAANYMTPAVCEQGIRCVAGPTTAAAFNTLAFTVVATDMVSFYRQKQNDKSYQSKDDVAQISDQQIDIQPPAQKSQKGWFW